MDLQNQSSQIEELKCLILNSNLSNKDILDIDECCKFTNMSKSYLYKLTHLRLIPFYKPNGGKLYFKKSEVVDWLLSNKQSSNQELNLLADEYLNNNGREL